MTYEILANIIPNILNLTLKNDVVEILNFSVKLEKFGELFYII